MNLSATLAESPARSRRRAGSHAAAADPRLYYLRVVTTGFSFLLFGVVGTILGIVFVPLLLVTAGIGQSARQVRVRHMIRLAFRSLVGFMNQTGRSVTSSPASSRSDGAGQLVIANHPSLIDIVLLVAFVPGAACVVKRAAWRNPSMVLAVRAAGFVPNAPTDAMIERAATLLSAGECLIMFPEGTRTVPYRPAHFHRGAASVALRAASA